MRITTLTSLFVFLLVSCSQKQNQHQTKPETTVEEPSEWIKQATIYEANIRQMSELGDFASFQKELPRLKELGVDVLWLMPIFPVGEVKRKAKGDLFVEDIEDEKEREKYLGSPYSVKDYKAVNPDFGTMDEFKSLVEECHKLGMKVILDWVANHSAWDNAWVTDHPEWYTQVDGKITDPLNGEGESIGWTDVADFNYNSPGLHDAMIDAMEFWVRECDIDGYRCDVAMEVPAVFWNGARRNLDSIKPVFMLAESEEHQMEIFDEAFDAYYGWEMHHHMNQVAKGEEHPSILIETALKKDTTFGGKARSMNFITNHDENSWNGTLFERMQMHYTNMAVLAYTIPGLPLIYSGQEAGLNHRLKFFEKDTISWNLASAETHTQFYRALNNIKQSEESLAWDSPLFSLSDSLSDVVTYERGVNKDLRVHLNFSFNERSVDTTGYHILLGELSGDHGRLAAMQYVILKKD